MLTLEEAFHISKPSQLERTLFPPDLQNIVTTQSSSSLYNDLFGGILLFVIFLIFFDKLRKS